MQPFEDQASLNEFYQYSFLHIAGQGLRTIRRPQVILVLAAGQALGTHNMDWRGVEVWITWGGASQYPSSYWSINGKGKFAKQTASSTNWALQHQTSVCDRGNNLNGQYSNSSWPEGRFPQHRSRCEHWAGQERAPMAMYRVHRMHRMQRMHSPRAFQHRLGREKRGVPLWGWAVNFLAGQGHGQCRPFTGDPSYVHLMTDNWRSIEEE